MTLHSLVSSTNSVVGDVVIPKPPKADPQKDAARFPSFRNALAYLKQDAYTKLDPCDDFYGYVCAGSASLRTEPEKAVLRTLVAFQDSFRLRLGVSFQVLS